MATHGRELTSATYAGGGTNETYTYDKSGNRTTAGLHHHLRQPPRLRWHLNISTIAKQPHAADQDQRFTFIDYHDYRNRLTRRDYAPPAA